MTFVSGGTRDQDAENALVIKPSLIAADEGRGAALLRVHRNLVLHTFPRFYYS